MQIKYIQFCVQFYFFVISLNVSGIFFGKTLAYSCPNAPRYSSLYDFVIQFAPHFYNVLHTFTICYTLFQFAPHFYNLLHILQFAPHFYNYLNDFTIFSSLNLLHTFITWLDIYPRTSRVCRIQPPNPTQSYDTVNITAGTIIWKPKGRRRIMEGHEVKNIQPSVFHNFVQMFLKVKENMKSKIKLQKVEKQ